MTMKCRAQEVVSRLMPCCQAWAILYLGINLLTTSWALHFIVIGLLLCLVSYLRLPPPSPALTTEILGPSPNSPDDSEVCWEVAHRAACLDAPENSLEAVRLLIELLVLMLRRIRL